jgi:hypothetical protein
MFADNETGDTKDNELRVYCRHPLTSHISFAQIRLKSTPSRDRKHVSISLIDINEGHRSQSQFTDPLHHAAVWYSH